MLAFAASISFLACEPEPGMDVVNNGATAVVVEAPDGARTTVDHQRTVRVADLAARGLVRLRIFSEGGRALGCVYVDQDVHDSEYDLVVRIETIDSCY